MSKRATETREDQVSHEAIKPDKFKALDAKVANAEKTMTDARNRKSELVADAVQNEKLHPGAYGVFRKLRKMDPVAREAFRFHFEVYCEREWGKNSDLLRVTGEKPAASEDDADESDEDDAPVVGTPPGEPDLRPRNLRQPGASAAAHVQDLAAKAGAKPRPDEDALKNVGRGKPN